MGCTGSDSGNREMDQVITLAPPEAERQNVLADALSVYPGANTSTVSLNYSAIPQGNDGNVLKTDQNSTAHNTDRRLYHSNLLSTTHTTSCRDIHPTNDVFDDPTYTDSVQSGASGASLLKRCQSMPSNRSQSCKDISTFKDGNGLNKLQAPIIQVENPMCEESVSFVKQSVDITADSDTSSEHQVDKTICEPKKMFYIKNLLVISISLMFIFIAYMSLRNLQSSINTDGGLGVISLSIVYVHFFLGCIMATSVVQRIRPKRAIMMAMVFNTIYTITNFYPRYYTLVPGAILVGIGMGNLWTAHATYVTNIAIAYVEITAKPLANVLSTFNGIYYVFYGLAQIIGGIIASVVLNGSKMKVEVAPVSDAGHWNITSSSITDATILGLSDRAAPKVPPGTCGPFYCYTQVGSGVKTELPPSTLYLLLSIYTGCSIMGLIVLTIFLDPLKGAMKKSTTSVGTQLASVFRWFGNIRVILIVPLMTYTLFQAGFLFGDFTKAFVTCSVGVHMVGYVAMCNCIVASCVSFLNGTLLKLVGRQVLFLTAGTIQFSLLIVMMVWEPSSENVTVLFVIAGVWGIGDGIWFTQIVSLLGVLYEKNKVPAFAGLKMLQALGAAVAFSSSRVMCMRAKLYFVASVLATAMVGYVIMEVILRRDKKQRLQVIEEQEVIEKAIKS